MALHALPASVMGWPSAGDDEGFDSDAAGQQ
jgi:hypothetical protein